MLSINSTVNNNVVEVKLVGRFTVASASEADEAFAEAAGKGMDVVLDMSELDYIASAGLRSIKRLSKSVKDNNCALTVRNVQSDVMDVLEMTGFAAMLNIE